MNKTVLRLVYFLFFFVIQTTVAQNYQWAFTASKTPRTQSVTIREDHGGNFYLATFTDSNTVRLYSEFEKRGLNQQVIWQKQIAGNVTISDLEINAANHAVVTGYFEGTISIDGTILTGFPTNNSGFIFECDETGFVLWAHIINPINEIFEPVDLFIAPNGLMYLTSELTSTSQNLGFCAFHKLDAQGNIIQNEFNNNFENRTFSHILADSAGNVYLSGTCGNGATFDALNANPAFSYQNFLVKYDSSFNAQWIICKNYITFDHNNRLGMAGQNLYWAFNDFAANNGADTVKILRTDFNGQVLNNISGPLGMSFFPGIDFSVDRSGNSTLVIESFVRLFIYRYDAAFNIVWQDTLMTQTSGFPLHTGLVCYDSCFYLTSAYINDTLIADNFTLLNPNTGANYPSDIFVLKWGYSSTTSIINEIEIQKAELTAFPNPSSYFIELNAKAGTSILISDVNGKLIYNQPYSGKIDTSHFPDGIYYAIINDQETGRNSSTRFIISH